MELNISLSSSRQTCSLVVVIWLESSDSASLSMSLRLTFFSSSLRVVSSALSCW